MQKGLRRVLAEDGRGMEKQWGRPAEAGRHPLFYFLQCSSSDSVPLAFLSACDGEVYGGVPCCPFPNGKCTGTGAMLHSAQRYHRGHVADRVSTSDVPAATLCHVALEGEVYGGRPRCPFPNGTCKSWCHVAQCSNKLHVPCCRGASTSDVPAVTLGHVAFEGEVYV